MARERGNEGAGGGRAGGAPDGAPPPPAYPGWLLEHLRDQREFLDSLSPFPFSPPADATGFVALHQNNYLRLAHHPAVVRARRRANRPSGEDPSAASLLGGASREHEAFRFLLARSLRAGGVILATSGWAANVGVVGAVTHPRRPVYLDAGAHPSLLDGCRLARARARRFRHGDPAHLERRVRVHGPGVVCADALCSTDGTLCDLEGLVEVCERYDCILVLDEAHSFGIFGAGGGGLAVQLGLSHRVHFRTLSLSKALGGYGGAVAGGEEMVRTLSAGMRPVIFSSPTSPVLGAGHSAALEVMRREPERAGRCLAGGALLGALLRERGVPGVTGESQIVALHLPVEAGCELHGRLRLRGVLTSLFLHPAVPPGESRVRFSIHAEVSGDDLRTAAEGLTGSLREMGLLA